jgi:hypothetical protein
MKNSNLRKSIAILLFVFAMAFAAHAQEQQTFKIGDKVEFENYGYKFTGVIAKDEGGGYYSGKNNKGGDFFMKASDLRLYREPAPQPVETSQTSTAEASESSSPNCEGNDWAAWGVYKELEFMNSARDKYSTGFSIPTKDLICMVKTRKVAFRLTTAEEKELNDLRSSPELIDAIRENYIGGAEKTKSKGTTASVQAGRYACGKMAGIAGSMRFEARPDIFITGDGNYKNLASTGAFSYDTKTQTINWKSGPLAGKAIIGKYEPSVITLYNAKNEILYSCTLADK